MRLYVGNLPFAMGDEELRALFAPYGELSYVKVILDRETGRSRGFGFVEFPDDAEGEAAIAAVHGSTVEGRNLVVNQARERQPRPGGFQDQRGGTRGGSFRDRREQSRRWE